MIKLNIEKFKKYLQIIIHIVDQIFDFDKKIALQIKINSENFIKSGPYLYLRSGMIEQWNTFNKFHTYHYMVKLIIIN